jgi:PTS system fructose-specific IIA component/PTS system nitrogen regulatory IIA component
MESTDLRILVPLENPGAEESLVRLAATLAQSRSGELHLTHIVTDEDTLPQTERLLQEACELSVAMGVPAIPHLVEGSTVTAGIQDTLRQWQCNMMVMGWYHDVEEDAVLSATNRSLTKAVNVDTLIFKDRDFHPARRILAPTGGGNNALMGIQIGHDLAQTWGAEVEVLRIARDPNCMPEDPIFKRYCTQVYDNTKLQLELLGVDHPITILPSQDIVAPIVNRIKKDDLVVLGASNDWRQAGYLAGSIPDEIANQIPSSVLMVRSPTPNTVLLSNVFWEQTIRLDLRPKDKWEAITQLVDALVDEKQVPLSQRQLVLDAALQREDKNSTSLGHQTAIPHAPIPELPNVIGCLGICPDGVDFGGIYDEPVHFVFLLLTPQQNYRNYIPVLAQISSLMRLEETRKLFTSCQTPAEIMFLLKQQERL